MVSGNAFPLTSWDMEKTTRSHLLWYLSDTNWHVLYRDDFQMPRGKAFHCITIRIMKGLFCYLDLPIFKWTEYLKVLEDPWHADFLKFVDDFNFWKFWLCLVFTAAHGPSLVGASGGYCLVVVCVGFSFNTFLYHSLEMGIFWCLLSSFFLSLFPVLCLHLLWPSLWLNLCNITLALL